VRSSRTPTAEGSDWKQTVLENPTTLVVVDRTELESQMWRNLASFGFPTREIARGKDHLQDLPEHKYESEKARQRLKEDEIAERREMKR